MTDPGSPAKPLSGAPAQAAQGPTDLPSIYRSELAYVWKTLRRLGAPPADLEDLAHDVFVVVHRHLSDYDPARPLRPWLFGIAVRVVSDHRRVGRNSREIPGQDVEPVDGTPSAQDRLEGREARALLMRALDDIDLEQRAVLVMHDLDELPVPEIAATLSIPLNTAYSRLRLARAAVVAWIARFRGRDVAP